MTTPRISINKLGEYMDATASRRKQIIKDQQDPKPFKVARYKDAKDEIVDYLSKGMADDTKITSSIDKLRIPNGGSDFTEQDRQSSAHAIENFLEIADEIDIDGLNVETVDSFSSNIMEISGVDISMRPDAILKDNKSGEIVGCVKLHFPKSNPLSENSAEYVATGMRFYLENSLGKSEVKANKCYVVDISTGLVVTAPKAFKRKMNDITAACEEIKARWNT